MGPGHRNASVGVYNTGDAEAIQLPASPRRAQGERRQ
jgi:hypothetical protein